ncbi:MAG: zinc ribbon domain-containing protein [Anaerolineae bacterium]|nr:zinc ribbon domain-containing protein [Anaerolineae bacterium]
MIYCPECGTANRDGSKFCNECGHTLLAQTGVKCPHCDTLNAVQSVFCSHCGGRLLAQPIPVPTTVTPPIKGLSLPTKTTVGEGGETAEQPPAEELEAPQVPPVEPSTRGPRQEGAGELMGEEGEEIPDWLRDLQASLPVEPEAEEPELTPRPLPLTPETEAQQAPEPDRFVKLEQAAEAEEELPDWLAELKPAFEGEAPEPPSPVPVEPLAHGPQPEAVGETGEEAELEAEELPDWLAELKPAFEGEAPEPPSPFLVEPLAHGPQPEAVGEAVEEAELEPEEPPDWLAELKLAAEGKAPAEPPVEAELEEEELPAWLTELKPTAEAEAPASVPVQAEPDWLAELQAPAPQPPPTVEAPLPPTEVELEEGELPPWLAELKEERGPLPSVSGEGQAVEEAATVGSPIGRRGEAPPGAPPAAEEAPEAQAVPGWLSDLVTAQASLDAPLAEGELPDWLVPTPESELVGEEEALARAEIPDWLLALKPRELKAEGEIAGVESAVEEVVEQTGILAGIRDILPIEMLIAQPRAAGPAEVVESPSRAEAALVDASRVRLFEEIVTRPPMAAPKVLAKSRGRLIDLLPWWIVYALLILAVAVPLLLDKPLFDRSIEPAPSVEALYQAVESLPDNAQVLLAADYDPTTSGEMDLVAQSLVGHLMDRQARIAIVSLLPAGPATAKDLVEKVAASHPGYQAGDGQRYVNLGYLPGQAAAVRLMGQSLPDALPRDFEGRQAADLAALSGITSTQSFDLIVALAAAPDTLRWWIEQAGAPYGVSLVAGVSAAVDPMARTYFETEPQQLKGMIGGVPGAASYESLRSGGAGPGSEMAARLDSLLVGQVFVILVILGGNLIRPKRAAQGGMGREK